MTTKLDGTNGVIFPDGTSQATAGVPLGSSQLCKAWVNFNGSTGGIRASFNVSSITRSAAGQYYVNFTNTFADTNYAVVGSGARSTSSFSYTGAFPDTTSRCYIGLYDPGTGFVDNTYQSVAVYR